MYGGVIRGERAIRYGYVWSGNSRGRDASAVFYISAGRGRGRGRPANWPAGTESVRAAVRTCACASSVMTDAGR